MPIEVIKCEIYSSTLTRTKDDVYHLRYLRSFFSEGMLTNHSQCCAICFYGVMRRSSQIIPRDVCRVVVWSTNKNALSHGGHSIVFSRKLGGVDS